MHGGEGRLEERQALATRKLQLLDVHLDEELGGGVEAGRRIRRLGGQRRRVPDELPKVVSALPHPWGGGRGAGRRRRRRSILYKSSLSSRAERFLDSGGNQWPQ